MRSILSKLGTIGLSIFLPVGFAFAQPDLSKETSSDPDGVQRITAGEFIPIKKQFSTSVKDQARTSTCWSFATVSMVESQTYKNRLGAYDLSEMFIARNIYKEKAKNYILRQGKAQFSQGALAHDAIRAIAQYGVLPDVAYYGLLPAQRKYNHDALFAALKNYVDSVVQQPAKVIQKPWEPGFEEILNSYMGVVPGNFVYNQKKYSPKTFASEILKFDANDYVCLTSFTHHPFYEKFIPEVPDNFSNGSYYNLPLTEMMKAIKDAVEKGYTVLWDTDVSNDGFVPKKGLALHFNEPISNLDTIQADSKEASWNANQRQQLFENLTTQDDHLMHIVGIEKTKSGKLFYMVKNSWGDAGPFGGYIHASEAYIAINTITIVVPKAALDVELLKKLKQ
jgi:bleomycin hydrolase